MDSLLVWITLVSTCLAVWPRPQHSVHGDAVLWLSSNVEFICRSPKASLVQSVLGYIRRDADSQPSVAHPCNEMVQSAIARTHQVLFTQSLVPWMLHQRHSQFEPPADGDRANILAIDIVEPRGGFQDSSKLTFVDESYSITVKTTGRFLIKAQSTTGVVRALDTVTQLFYQHSKSELGLYMNNAPLEIKDKPRYQHRALNLDVARNWYPVDDILKTIDVLSWNKFNRLHLHVTDSQSWPLEIPALPELARKGAFYRGLSYSPEDVKRMQSYAAARGIEVILEVDMPPHTASIAHGYLGLVTAADVQPDWRTYAAEPPSGQLKLNSSSVDDFVKTLLDDLLPRLKDHSAFFHTGGDELNLNSYLLDETVRSNDHAVIKPLLQRFIDRVHDRVRAHGVTPIVWEEMLLDWNLDLGKDVIVQSWRNDDAVREIVDRGYRVIAGNFLYWYLDCGHGAWILPRPKALSLPNSHSTQFQFDDYCSPYKPWQWIYSYDPLTSFRYRHERSRSEHDSNMVLGAEVHLWSELTDPVNLDGKLWPRASAAAEVLWSGPQLVTHERSLNASGKINKSALGNNVSESRSEHESNIAADIDFVAVGRRLAEWRARMVARGVRAEVVQMIWCTQAGVQSCTY